MKVQRSHLNLPTGPSVLELSARGYAGDLTERQRLDEIYAIQRAGELTPEQFKDRRTELGYTQGSLARMLRVHPQSISNWERFGPVPADVATLMRTLPHESGLTQELSKLAPGEVYHMADWVASPDGVTNEANIRALYKRFKVPSLRGRRFDYTLMDARDPSKGHGVIRRY